ALLMTVAGWLQIIVFFLVILAITKPLGAFMYRVFESEQRPLGGSFGRIERMLLRLCGAHDAKEQTWLEYTVSMLLFSAFGLVVTYLIQRCQGSLPLNPQHLPNVPPALSFNTAASFTT